MDGHVLIERMDIYALFKTEQKATDLIKYKHKIGFDYL
jgi:hypothetical protein